MSMIAALGRSGSPEGEGERSFALLTPREAPSLRDSSPHVLDFGRFASMFGGSARRRTLLGLLERRLDRLAGLGLMPRCLLAGGGFVRAGGDPSDFDGLLVYCPRPGIEAAGAVAALREAVPGLDLRYVPGDSGPELLIKMSCFFHTLYQSRDRDGAQPSFLIPLEDRL